MGEGRLADPADIVAAAERDPRARTTSPGCGCWSPPGGTREPIDAVRIITNRSSGKQGYAIAEVAARRGADVTLVTTIGRPAPSGVEIVPVQTAAEMQDAVMARARRRRRDRHGRRGRRLPAQGTARPQAQEARGHPRDRARAHPRLPRRPRARQARAARCWSGSRPRPTTWWSTPPRSCARKRLDLIVGNDISQPDAGFEVDTNRAVILDADGGSDALPLLAKSDLAGVILDKVARLLDQKRPSRERAA